MVHKMFRKQQNPTMCKGVIKQSVSLSSLKALITECFFCNAVWIAFSIVYIMLKVMYMLDEKLL